jgi:hypothetical protein
MCISNKVKVLRDIFEKKNEEAVSEKVKYFLFLFSF